MITRSPSASRLCLRTGIYDEVRAPVASIHGGIIASIAQRPPQRPIAESSAQAIRILAEILRASEGFIAPHRDEGGPPGEVDAAQGDDERRREVDVHREEPRLLADRQVEQADETHLVQGI